jgi:hypothetical protein
MSSFPTRSWSRAEPPLKLPAACPIRYCKRRGRQSNARSWASSKPAPSSSPHRTISVLPKRTVYPATITEFANTRALLLPQVMFPALNQCMGTLPDNRRGIAGLVEGTADANAACPHA